MSLPFSFLFAILDPNCKALLGNVATFCRPILYAINRNISLSPIPGARLLLGKHLEMHKTTFKSQGTESSIKCTFKLKWARVLQLTRHFIPMQYWGIVFV